MHKCQAAVVHNYPIHYKHLLFKSMREAGLRFVVIFVSSRSAIRIEPILLSQDAYNYLIGHDGPYEKHPRLKTCFYIWRALTKMDPEVVIISGYYDVAGWTAWIWAQTFNRRIILWNAANSFDSKRPVYKNLLKRLYLGRLDMAHVYGVSQKEYLIELGMCPENILIKGAVADTKHFRPMSVVEREDRDPLALLFVGRLSKEKNLLAVVRAVANANKACLRRKLVLSIVGYGPQKEELLEAISQLGLELTIRIEPPLLQADIPQRYNEADVFILPSIYEPWGLVTLEAMLCGLPALVSTQCGCARDLITTQTGWTFSPFDDTALTRLLEKVADTHRETLKAMGASARRRALQYSPEACARIVTASVLGLTASKKQFFERRGTSVR